MSDHVYWILTLEINQDQKENLAPLMAEMVSATQKDEPGALNYEWSVSADGTTCHILERYENSDATMIHMRNFSEKFANRFMKVFTQKSFTLYGQPSDSVLKAFAPMQPRQMVSVGGFSR